MYNDSPITNDNSDKLNRKKFAESLANSIIALPKCSDSIVIGLMGGWGTGKSSLLNLTENKLKNKVNILRFNPWNYYNQQMLFSSFFDELTGCLEFNDKTRALFQKYKYRIIGSGISWGSTAAPELRLLNNFIPDSEYKTLNNMKEKLKSLFKKQQKTVVIIDDIDRLNPDEVKQIFQLVKSLADFPNLIYIMAFDKDYVNYALKEWNRTPEEYSHAEDFIDKIVQVPLTIPKFNGEDFYEIFKCKFEKILNNHNPNVENFNMKKLYNLLFPFLKNIRDINRFCNAMDFYLYSMDTEIWVHDFALVTALQIFEKDIYDSVKYNQKLLTGDLKSFDEQIDLIDSLGGNLKNYLNDLFNGNLKHEDIIKQILSDLFPKVNYIINSSSTPESEISIKKQHCGIMQKEYFDLYFLFDNTNRLSRSRIDSVIQAANNNDVKELKTRLLLINEMDLIDSLINQLENHVDKFEDEGIKNLIKVFNDNYNELFVDNPYNPQNLKISKAICLICNLIKGKNLDDNSIYKAIDETENSYFKTCLIWEVNNWNLLNKDLMSELKKDISDHLSDCFEKKKICEITHVSSKMRFWKDFTDFKVTNDYINNLNDEELIKFISEYKEYDFFQEKYMIQYESLETVVELDSIHNRLEKIKDLNNLNKKQTEIVDLFLDNYSGNISA